MLCRGCYTWVLSISGTDKSNISVWVYPQIPWQSPSYLSNSWPWMGQNDLVILVWNFLDTTSMDTCYRILHAWIILCLVYTLWETLAILLLLLYPTYIFACTYTVVQTTLPCLELYVYSNFYPMMIQQWFQWVDKAQIEWGNPHPNWYMYAELGFTRERHDGEEGTIEWIVRCVGCLI